MQAVILAAGKGTRMRPLTYDIPKPMLPIKERPILEYTLDALPSAVDEVIFVVNYLGEHIQNHFGLKWQGRKIHYVLQEELNGTGGALHSAKHLLKDDFLVVMGDDLYHSKDLEGLARNGLAILAFEVKDPSRFGVFRTDESGNLVEIIENPETMEYKLVNAAAYKLDKSFFDYELVPKIPGDSEFGLPQTIVSMVKDHPIKIVRARAWFPVGFPEDLPKAEKYLSRIQEE